MSSRRSDGRASGQASSRPDGRGDRDRPVGAEDMPAMRLNYSEIWRAVAQALPARPAIVSRDGTLTYAELTDRAARLAQLLHEAGIRRGDRVVLFTHNRPEQVIALFAALAMGATPVPVNFRYRAGEVQELLDDCGARAVVFAASLAPVVRALPGDGVTAWLRIDDVDDDGTPRTGERAFGDLGAAPACFPELPPADGELFLYTGGTTGRPKAVVWGADDLLDVQMYSIYGALDMPRPASLAEIVEVARGLGDRAPVMMPIAPLMHGTALFNTMNTLVLGGTLVFLPDARFDPDAALDLARRHAVTRLTIAGDAIAAPLVERAEERGMRLPALSSVISSGMRFSDPLKRRLHELGDLRIFDLLASSEGGPYAVAATSAADDVPAPLTLFPGAVVLDDADEEIQDRPGTRGRLAFRGPLPRGYHGDARKTAETFRDVRGSRHVIAGDLVRVLGDGRVELLGRGSAVVNTGGEKVFPAEVEEVLLTHPLISDAVVFGTPDERFGEVVTAVIAAPGAMPSAADVRAFVDGRLAGYKKPRIIDVRRSLERTPSGKVDMRRLAEQIAARPRTRPDPHAGPLETDS